VVEKGTRSPFHGNRSTNFYRTTRQKKKENNAKTKKEKDKGESSKKKIPQVNAVWEEKGPSVILQGWANAVVEK